MVMGRDLCSKGCGLESQHRILDGHFITLICSQNNNDCLKKTKKKRKRGRGWPIGLYHQTGLTYPVISGSSVWIATTVASYFSTIFPSPQR